jgi:ferredoxin-like protein FixX
MDSDEYYLLKEFKHLKKVMLEGDYNSSACKLQTYYKEPIYRLDPPEDYYVSLLYKINNSSSYSLGSRLPVLVDPTRCMEPGKCKIFTRDEIEMHHFSYIRKSVRKKLQNSSAVINFKDRINKLVDYHEKWKYPEQALMAGAPDKLYNIIKVNKEFDIWV